MNPNKNVILLNMQCNIRTYKHEVNINYVMMRWFKRKKKSKKQFKKEYKCSRCGSILQKVKEDKSKFYCPNCKVHHQRSQL